MPRISKVEKERRALREVRAEKAIESLTAQFRKLLTKHAGNLFKPETEIAAQMSMNIATDGNASLRFGYQTTVTDGAHFPLDDGQEEMALEPGKTPAPAAPGA